MKEEMKRITDHLLSVGSVGLLTHINPDWDCLGSCLALQTVLRDRGITCDIITDEPLTEYMSCLDSEVVIYGGGALKYDCLCCVDCGDGKRIGRRGAAFASHRNRVCIDHHRGGEEGFAQLSYVDVDSPATGEIIYDMLKNAGIPITAEAAAYLYCAISTDTGSFKYASTTGHTLRIAAEIMDMGVNTSHLCELLYDRKSFRQLRLQGEAINTVELHCGGKIATAYVTGEMYKKYNADNHDTENFANLPREIDGVVMSAFLSDRGPDGIRVNFRSKDGHNVRQAAVALGGGGHTMAAGCTLKNTNMEKAVKTVAAEMEKALEGENR